MAETITPTPNNYKNPGDRNAEAAARGFAPEPDPMNDHWADVVDLQTSSQAARRLDSAKPVTPRPVVSISPDVAKPRVSTSDKVMAAALTGVVLAGGGVLANATIGGEIRDALTPDKNVGSVGFTLYEGDALQTDVSKAAHDLVLQKKIDPAKVDFGSLPDLANAATTEARKVFDEKELQAGNNFNLVMIDTGNGYKFTLAPDDTRLADTSH